MLGGDTIEVLITNQTYRVRYIGVDSPNIEAPSEWQSGQAMSFNQSLVEGKLVTLIQDVDRPGCQWLLPALCPDQPGICQLRNVTPGIWQDGKHPTRYDLRQFAAVCPGRGARQHPGDLAVDAGADLHDHADSHDHTDADSNEGPDKNRNRRSATAWDRRLTCNSFPSQRRAQQCFEYCRSQGYGDIFGLDKNGNGLACEGSYK